MTAALAQAWTRLRQEAAAGGQPPRSPALPPSFGPQAHPSAGPEPGSGQRSGLRAVAQHPDGAA